LPALERPTREEHDALRRRHDAMTDAVLDLQIRLSSMRTELETVKADRARLEAQVNALQATLQTLGTDNNSRYDASNREVERLRTLLKANGVQLGG